LQKSQKARRLISRQRTKQATIADQWGFKRATRIVCEFGASRSIYEGARDMAGQIARSWERA
jgi:hypothetical protein